MPDTNPALDDPQHAVIFPHLYYAKEIKELNLSLEQWGQLKRNEKRGKNRPGLINLADNRIYLMHPAMIIYRGIAMFHPPKTWTKRIMKAVGTELDNLAIWNEVVLSWVITGHDPHNVKGMLVVYLSQTEI